MNKRILYIQILLEAALPILGFFMWNWSLYFILLFYLFDLLANELTVQLKAFQINKYHGGRSRIDWLKNAIVSLAILGISVLFIHIGMRLEHPEIDFIKEAIAFWTYEELGIQQGYLFLPLVFYMAYQEYKMLFLMPARYRTVSMKELWKSHNYNRVLLLLGSVLGCVILYVTPLPEIAVVLSIIVAVSGLSLWKLNHR